VTNHEGSLDVPPDKDEQGGDEPPIDTNFELDVRGHHIYRKIIISRTMTSPLRSLFGSTLWVRDPVLNERGTLGTTVPGTCTVPGTDVAAGGEEIRTIR
jgi:hypothetical protein